MEYAKTNNVASTTSAVTNVSPLGETSISSASPFLTSIFSKYVFVPSVFRARISVGVCYNEIMGADFLSVEIFSNAKLEYPIR